MSIQDDDAMILLDIIAVQRRDLQALKAELENVDRLRSVRRESKGLAGQPMFIVDIDDDPKHVQFHGAGATVRQALRFACECKRAALAKEG